VRGDEGREIGGFRIESEIGRGGMGIVYLAHQSFPERKIALKLLSPDLASDPAFRDRFVHESNAAASTEHPNIVPVYGAGEADGQLYLAMRFIEGTDLGALLGREGALSPERAAQICAEIADALDAAHDRGLIHRDVKPGNILLDARDRAYLTDFGLIRRTQLHTDVTKTGQFMGTIDYCAPEQIKAARSTDGPTCTRSDASCSSA
jgi:serine/threonine protein kinase